VPPFDRAAMDGYAVAAADTAGAAAGAPRTLGLVGRVFTGEAPPRRLSPGECFEIATGAPLPPGADAVVMVEETDHGRDDARRVQVFAAVRPGQNVGRRGGDIETGQAVIGRGDVVTPSRIGAIAAAGVTDLEVYGRPSIALLSTGDELVEPGRPLGHGQIHEVNRFTLAAVIARHGGTPVLLPTARDAPEALARALETALVHDVVVCSGGTSVGERDLVLDIVRDRGEIVFHGIAVKPGKPTLFGRIGRTPILGLPGNPTSCLSNAYLLLVPFLRTLARLPEWQPKTVDVPLARRVTSTADRHQFYTVRLVNGRAEPAFKSSGEITSMANADGYIEIAVGIESVEAETTVRVTLF
jgi:molybdenum cofactor synthesis domain-containing protein